MATGIWGFSLSIRVCKSSTSGRALLSAAEDFAKARGASSIRMGVLSVRDALIAWYLRRGYQLTGETEPYPYGDNRFGTPLRDDLKFVILEKQV